MLNQVICVGRIKNMKDTGDNLYIKVAVSRSYKNENGEYEYDTLEVMVKEGMKNNILTYCKNEDLVGIKGRLEETNFGMIIVAEKITFLSSNGGNNNE